MDLYNHEQNMIKMLGQMRYDAATAHNERVTARRQQVARDILTAKRETQDDIASENTEEMAKGGVASISTAIDANSARGAIKDTIKKKAEDAVKSQVKSSINSVAKKIEDPHGVPHDTRTMNPLVDTAEETEKMAKRVSDSGLRSRVSNKMEEKMATKLGKAGLKSAGSLMNVGMGLDALHDDFKGGQFHLAGKNGLEEASNALQIASGVADVVGLALPPVLAVGMLLGAASSVTGAVGEVQEVEADEAKQRKKTAEFTDKAQASLSGLHMMDADKARASAMNIDRTINQTRTTQKVAG
tara:strand:+ start:184 stop:1080 length:897 start_codon:yes stop_codon:yes gene_type:complete